MARLGQCADHLYQIINSIFLFLYRRLYWFGERTHPHLPGLSQSFLPGRDAGPGGDSYPRGGTDDAAGL